MSVLIRILGRLVAAGDVIAKVLPTLLRLWAEGKLFGEKGARVYWWLAGKKTVTGAILLALGTGLEAVAAGYPELAWAPVAARVIFWTGAALSSIGLVDGGVRSPWPKGTEIPAKFKS